MIYDTWERGKKGRRETWMETWRETSPQVCRLWQGQEATSKHTRHHEVYHERVTCPHVRIHGLSGKPDCHEPCSPATGAKASAPCPVRAESQLPSPSSLLNSHSQFSNFLSLGCSQHWQKNSARAWKSTASRSQKRHHFCNYVHLNAEDTSSLCGQAELCQGECPSSAPGLCHSGHELRLSLLREKVDM